MQTVRRARTEHEKMYTVQSRARKYKEIQTIVKNWYKITLKIVKRIKKYSYTALYSQRNSRNLLKTVFKRELILGLSDSLKKKTC